MFALGCLGLGLDGVRLNDARHTKCHSSFQKRSKRQGDSGTFRLFIPCIQRERDGNSCFDSLIARSSFLHFAGKQDFLLGEMEGKKIISYYANSRDCQIY